MSEAELVIRRGLVVDGTGAARRRADVGIASDRIVAVGEVGRADGAREIDATGRIVAPGFIDAHTHDDRALLSMPEMTPKVSQGVTTVVAGNCGVRAATAVELGEMRRQVAAAMAEGAIGFSTGLDYPSAVAAPTEEIVALVEAVKPSAGLYCAHHRDYFDGLEAAIDEALAIGRETGVPLTLFHHQCTGAANFGKAPETLEVIDRARRTQAIGLDAYPYHASSKTLDPGRARPGVPIMVTWSTPHPQSAGRMLDEIAAEWQCGGQEAAERLLPAGAIYFQLDERDVRAILAYEHTMIGSDGLPHDVHPHPRLWGTFPRVLGHYSRELALFPLEEAVRRMTGLPARWFGFADRGVIRPGALADLVVFDAATVRDTGTFSEPAQPAAGIDLVMVNGQVVWRTGRHTGARPGRVLRRAASA